MLYLQFVVHCNFHKIFPSLTIHIVLEALESTNEQN